MIFLISFEDSYQSILYKNSVFIRKSTNLILAVFVCVFNISIATGQNIIPADSTNIKPDTLEYDEEARISTDTTRKDSTIIAVHKKEKQVDAPVQYSASDSMIFNIKEQKVYLFNGSQINYKEIELKADYIEISFEKNEAFASGVKDSTGKEIGKPEFKDGGDEFTAQTLRYNFNTKKGIITGVITEQSGGFLHSEKTKRLEDGNVCLKNGLYTTCNLEHPHYYINLTKAKVIPDDKIISGPAYLVIEDVPVPLGIPFGFFPNKKGNKSGILIPEYGEEDNRGFYLKNGGYYFAISDYVDATLRGEVFTKGSWGANLSTNYLKRYKYNGNVFLSYVKLVIGEKEVPSQYTNTNTYWIKWNHAQDPKAHPNHTFSANVDLGSSTYNKYNTYSVDNRLRSDVQSSISFNQRWPNSPFNLSVNLRHSQNLLDSTVNLSVPELYLSMSRQQPFKTMGSKGKRRFYKDFYRNLGISYNTNISNAISTKEDVLFTDQTLHNFRNGMKHSIPVSTSMKFLKFFNLTPSLNYTERWYLQSINKQWLDSIDTVPGFVNIDTLKGFVRAGDYQISIPFTTKLYGYYQSRNPNAKIIALRHVATPTVSYSYRPDYAQNKYGYYETVQIDTAGNYNTYSIFSNGIFGSPGAGKYGLLNIGLGNIFEMKVRSKNDTVTGVKKIMILESLNFNSSYNMALDSMRWSNVNITARTTLFKALNINVSGVYDPYAYDSTGTKLNLPEWKYTGKAGRITRANISAGFNLNSDALKSKNKEVEPENTAEGAKQAAIAAGLPENYTDYYVDFKVPWNFRTDFNLYYTLNQNYQNYDTVKYRFKSTITKTMNFSGDLSITDKWKISFSTGYDLEKKKFTYTSMNIYRDLHCWEMRLSWIPFGIYKSYNFSISVKSAVLQDLKLNRRRNWTENN